MKTQALAGLLLLLLGAGFARAQPSEIPLGHKDFYPSPERPVGYRGDGNGAFPGATPVTQWGEGTVGVDPAGLPVLTDHKAHNVVWKTEMPSWANTQPVVVGYRVFTTAEPNVLVCVDANTGKMLWTAAANPWELLGLDKDQADKVQAMYDLWREVLPHFNSMRHNGTMSHRVPSREFAAITDAFVEKALPRILKSLKGLDPGEPYEEAARVTAEAVKKYNAALAEAERTGAPLPFQKHDPIYGQMTRLQDALGRRINGFSSFTDSARRTNPKIPLEVPWGHLVGFCAAAPVSDGQYVYASFGQGQTVCYDLTGKRIWGTLHPPNRQPDNLVSLQAPLLAGDVLVDMHGGTKTLRGLDKRTGKVVWEAPTGLPAAVASGGYNVGCHKVVSLGEGKHSVKILVTTLCSILRVSDGKLLGTIPFAFRPGGGPSIVAHGDVVMKGTVGDNYRTPYLAYRLQLVGADRVEAKELWRTRRASTPGYQSVILSPTALLMSSFEHTALDPLTGKVLFRATSREAGIGGFSNILAGNVWLWAADGSRNWGSRGAAVYGSFGAADATDPTRIRLLTNQNVLGGVNKPRVPAMEKYAPELYALPFYAGNAYGWPAHFLHADTAIFPSGNRLFIRSLSALYCIGDPTVPYDWNRAARRVPLTELRTPNQEP